MFLTRDDAAAALSVSTDTVDRLIARGVLPTIPLPGRIVRIPEEAIRGLAWQYAGQGTATPLNSSKPVSVFSDGYPLRPRKPRRKS